MRSVEPWQAAYRQRRVMVADALGSSDTRKLSNNALSLTLGVSVQVVRWCRRKLEADGSIPAEMLRLGRDGRTFDVSAHVRYLATPAEPCGVR
jgi:hypothetical protein